jgi:hypothetical protein
MERISSGPHIFLPTMFEAKRLDQLCGDPVAHFSKPSDAVGKSQQEESP